jgi:beta-phosphoglucomutase-like phosphatase (HAD superfamily)
MLLALLFDLDGTMVDTDDLHIAAWNAVLARDGRQIGAPFYRTSIMGFAADAVTEALFPDHSPSHRVAMAVAKEVAFRSQVGDLEPTAGLPSVLEWAEALSLPMAVVTNAPRDNALLLLRGLGWAARFPVLVNWPAASRTRCRISPRCNSLASMQVRPWHLRIRCRACGLP